MPRKPIQLGAFISYSAQEKIYGGAVKRVFEEFGIDSFLAHEDLEVSQEWRNRILEELARYQIFVLLLSKAFRESQWAPQEIGLIVGRPDVLVIPLSIDGQMPFGFISHLQGRKIASLETIDELLIPPLGKAHPHAVIPGMIRRIERAGSYRYAEYVMKPLVPLFRELNAKELDALVEASIENGQVWSAEKCRMQYLPVGAILLGIGVG
jgi:TIR domain-containing protein